MISFLKAVMKLFLFSALLAGVMMAWWSLSSKVTSPPPEQKPPRLTVERLTEFSELTSLRVDVSDVLVRRIDGYTGGVQAVLLVRGDVDLNVDLRAAKLALVDDARRLAVVILNPPRTSRPRVDHSRTQLVSITKDGLWAAVPDESPYGAVASKAMADAQARVEEAAIGNDVSERSRKHVEDVLRTGCQALNWTVSVEWSDRAAADP